MKTVSPARIALLTTAGLAVAGVAYAVTRRGRMPTPLALQSNLAPGSSSPPAIPQAQLDQAAQNLNQTGGVFDWSQGGKLYNTTFGMIDRFMTQPVNPGTTQ